MQPEEAIGKPVVKVCCGTGVAFHLWWKANFNAYGLWGHPWFHKFGQKRNKDMNGVFILCYSWPYLFLIVSTLQLAVTRLYDTAGYLSEDVQWDGTIFNNTTEVLPHLGNIYFNVFSNLQDFSKSVVIQKTITYKRLYMSSTLVVCAHISMGKWMWVIALEIDCTSNWLYKYKKLENSVWSGIIEKGHLLLQINVQPQYIAHDWNWD